jgi:hypothetical protein
MTVALASLIVVSKSVKVRCRYAEHRVAPELRVTNISIKDGSNVGEANWNQRNLPAESRGKGIDVAWALIEQAAERWLTCTPLGFPVEPLVKSR